MRDTERDDKKPNAFSAKPGRLWLLAANYLCGVGVPISLLAAVLGGTRQLPDNRYAITNYFVLPFYVLIVCALLDGYVKRFEPADRRQTTSFMLLAMVLSAAIIVLSLPHLPLASHWHAPSPGTNIAVLILVELALLTGLLSIRWRRRRPPASKKFKG